MVELVGYTGFVGSNIYANGKIDKGYNSKNIAEAFGTKPDLLIYAGMRAEKYLANNNPDADMQLVYQAEENIRKISPKKLVLISTIDVLKEPNGKDEDAVIETEGLHPYGLNRYRLELWVRENFPDALIIRLPGLYGINIKKNFIYDYINVIPFMLKKEKMEELSCKEKELKNYYELQPNGFYKCRKISDDEKKHLKEIFRNLKFTALNFTDSRSIYQFYPLSRLWSDINIALEHNIMLLHPATEPISASELYRYLTGEQLCNELEGKPVFYDYRTKYSSVFHGENGYILGRQEILDDIRKFTGGME